MENQTGGEQNASSKNLATPVQDEEEQATVETDK